jgi:hypothetical protein
MKKGALLFAYNTPETDYLKLASITAERIGKFLDLPTTVITNQASIDTTSANQANFEKTVITDIVDKNYLSKKMWYNKGRFKAYEFSPYDDTLLIDVDYLINSNKLLKLFDNHDIKIHDKIRYLTTSQVSEQLGKSQFNTLWATIIRFQKTDRARHMFEMLEQVQKNYEYYSNIYKYQPYLYRNDYAVTVALKTVNGQLYEPKDFISWELLHIPDNVTVYKEADTVYNIERKDARTGKLEYIKLTNLDFHLMNKNNFLELFNA